MTHRSQTHHYRILIAALISASAFWTGAASAQVPVADGPHIGVQIEQWVRNYEQWTEEFNRWTKQFRQNAIGQIASLSGASVGTINNLALSDSQGRSNDEAYQATLTAFNQNNPCLQITATTAQSICNVRRGLELRKLNKLIELLKYNDTMGEKIKAAADAVESADGVNDPADAAQKMRALQALQNQLKNGVDEKTAEIKSFAEQVDVLNKQQAELTRTALRGKPQSVVGSVVQAVSMGAAFNAIKSTPSGNKSY